MACGALSPKPPRDNVIWDRGGKTEWVARENVLVKTILAILFDIFVQRRGLKRDKDVFEAMWLHLADDEPISSTKGMKIYLRITTLLN